MTSDRQQAAQYLDVSRETWAALDHYVDRLKAWQRAQNLVSAATLDQVWIRHISDCAQLYQLGASAGNWLDIGSGAGLPGLVGAILARYQQPQDHSQFVMVESNQRKCAFLRMICRELDLNCHIICNRIERLQPGDSPHISHISARAVAPLAQLLEWGSAYFDAGADAYLQKGRDYSAEVDIAADMFAFNLICYESVVETNSVILHLSDIQRRASPDG